jgi:hypothetical protein
MPTNKRWRRAARRTDVSELTSDQRRHLEHGNSFFGGFGGDLDAFSRAWEQHSAELLESFIDRFPGRRPFAWWLLEHRKERPILRTDIDPAIMRSRPGAFGFLHTAIHDGTGRNHLQEPEYKYLKRHGLLSDNESTEKGQA